MLSKRNVVIGFLGTTLDVGKAERRWKRWRPTVALAAEGAPTFERMELLCGTGAQDLAEVVVGDMKSLNSKIDVRVNAVTIADPWDFEEIYALLYDFARGYAFDLENEEYFLHITTGSHVMQICLFLLCESKIIPARLLQTSPRGDTAEGSRQVIDLDLSRYNKLAARFARSAVEASSLLKQGIQTKSRRYNELIDELELVASQTREPILLAGPTGVGKTSLAKRLFRLKATRSLVAPGGTFVEVNCATISGDVAKSTLFGHVRGAFTGAQKDQTGLLELAAGGVLFLDEIGELGLDEQAMLLRAVEDKVFRPLGAKTERQSDFQLICGTNRDLRREVGLGRFREDLLARINLWEFVLPSLRDRLEDLEPNLDFELDRHEQRTGQRVRFVAEARHEFVAFARGEGAEWPGNFRELGAAVTRMATLCGAAGRITVEIANKEMSRLRRAWDDRGVSAVASPEAAPSSDLPTGLPLFDRLQLQNVLTVCRECRSLAEAGRRLFGDEASNNASDRIRKYLLRFGLDPRSVLAR